jgi:curved DNA-binding protein CbpA
MNLHFGHLLLIAHLFFSLNFISYTMAASTPSSPPPPNYYELLGISPSASEQEIHYAYKKLAQKCHPDKGVCSDDKMKAIGQARRILSDPKSRSKYDNTIRDYLAKTRKVTNPSPVVNTVKSSVTPQGVYKKPTVKPLDPNTYKPEDIKTWPNAEGKAKMQEFDSKKSRPVYSTDKNGNVIFPDLKSKTANPSSGVQANWNRRPNSDPTKIYKQVEAMGAPCMSVSDIERILNEANKN